MLKPILRKSDFSNEMRFVLILIEQCLHKDISENDKFEINADLDLDKILHVIFVHKLAPFLIAELVKREDQYSRTIVSKLQDFSIQHTARTLRIINELKKVSISFADHQIDFVPLKGVVLGQQLYGDSSCRHLGDIDILVQQRDLKIALDLLINLGYTLRRPTLMPSNKRWKVLLNNFHHIVLSSKDQVVTIELHWRVENIGNWFSIERNKSHLVSVEMFGTTFGQFSNSQLFLFLSYHGSKHAWTSLHWLLDVAVLGSELSESDWKRLFRMAHASGYSTHFYIAISLASSLLGMRLPSFVPDDQEYVKWMDKHGSDLREMILAGKPETSKARFKLEMYKASLEKSTRNRLQSIFRTVYDLDDWNKTPLPDSLFFLYYIFRPFSWLARRGRGIINSLVRHLHVG